MFASDFLHLLEDGKAISDNATILIYRDGPVDSTDDVHERVEICEKGRFRIKQNQFPLSEDPKRRVEPLKLVFYRLKEAPKTMREWKDGKPGSKETYKSYLKKLTQTAKRKTEINLPTPDESQALRKDSHLFKPRKDELGGQIGDTRYFKLDLVTGSVEQFVSE